MTKWKYVLIRVRQQLIMDFYTLHIRHIFNKQINKMQFKPSCTISKNIMFYYIGFKANKITNTLNIST